MFLTSFQFLIYLPYNLCLIIDHRSSKLISSMIFLNYIARMHKMNYSTANDINTFTSGRLFCNICCSINFGATATTTFNNFVPTFWSPSKSVYSQKKKMLKLIISHFFFLSFTHPQILPVIRKCPLSLLNVTFF